MQDVTRFFSHVALSVALLTAGSCRCMIVLSVDEIRLHAVRFGATCDESYIPGFFFVREGANAGLLWKSAGRRPLFFADEHETIRFTWPIRVAALSLAS